MVLLPSWLLNEEIWEICFLKAALWGHQAHQDMAPLPPVVSAELISATQGHSQKNITQAHKKVTKERLNYSHPCVRKWSQKPTVQDRLLTGAPQTHMCFPGWPESSPRTSLFVPGHAQGLFQPDQLDNYFSCDSEFWCCCAWGPWEDCKHKPRSLDSAENATTVPVSLIVNNFAA